jgi:hypothetical protein
MIARSSIAPEGVTRAHTPRSRENGSLARPPASSSARPAPADPEEAEDAQRRSAEIRASIAARNARDLRWAQSLGEPDARLLFDILFVRRVHEAAHQVIAWRRYPGYVFGLITVRPQDCTNPAALGQCIPSGPHQTFEQMLCELDQILDRSRRELGPEEQSAVLQTCKLDARIDFDLASFAAEAVLVGGRTWWSEHRAGRDRDDIAQAWAWAVRLLHPVRDVEPYLLDRFAALQRELREPATWACVLELAAALEASGTIGAAEIEPILRRHLGEVVTDAVAA